MFMIGCGGTLPVHPLLDLEWENELSRRSPGGEWVGRVEQVLFFGSLLINWGIAATWLAFKLGSKWRTWTTTVQMLRPVPSDKTDRAKIIRAHLARAGLDHRLFIFGTGGNIVAGFAGLAVAKLFAGA